MRTKPDADIGPDEAKTSNTIEALLAELTADELEQVASAVVRDYQCRMQKAQALFEEISHLEAAGAQEDLACRRHDYRVVMLNVHAQHELVGLVVNRLGYVPELDGRRPTLN
ncbi:MAG: transcriptional repressor TraM [Geminicoccaceae bacterium]